MRILRRPATLPLGLDIGAASVSIVSAEARVDGFAVRETRTLEIPRVEPARLDVKVAEAIGTIVRGLTTRERRCVLAAPSAELVTRVFRVPPGMRRSEAQRAAALEAGTIVEWPLAERQIALDPIPGTSDDMLLSIARRGTIERLVAMARAGGLRPVAVDVPACAWRRAVPDADAVLDCSNERAELVIFGRPLGVTHVFPPRLVDERIAGHVRALFADARREGVADVQRLAILASPFRYETIEELLRGDGYAIAPVAVGGNEAPAWTFAFGLASWAAGARGLASA